MLGNHVYAIRIQNNRTLKAFKYSPNNILCSFGPTNTWANQHRIHLRKQFVNLRQRTGAKHTVLVRYRKDNRLCHFNRNNRIDAFRNGQIHQAGSTAKGTLCRKLRSPSKSSASA